MKGLIPALELFSREHRAIRGAATNLLVGFRRGDDLAGSLTFLSQVAENHFQAEERSWLPALEGNLRPLIGHPSPVLAIRAAHRTLRRLLAEVAGGTTAAIPFLCALLEDHATQEDHLLYPFTTALLDKTEAAAIGRELGIGDSARLPPAPPPVPGFRLRRAYDPPSPGDGRRVLVDRLWPRGLAREEARLDRWAKELAPSDDLRRWFDHAPERFAEFRRRYREELASQALSDELAELAGQTLTGPFTLLFAAADPAHNQAVVLREVLEERCLSREMEARWSFCAGANEVQRQARTEP